MTTFIMPTPSPTTSDKSVITLEFRKLLIINGGKISIECSTFEFEEIKPYINFLIKENWNIDSYRVLYGRSVCQNLCDIERYIKNIMETL